MKLKISLVVILLLLTAIPLIGSDETFEQFEPSDWLYYYGNHGNLWQGGYTINWTISAIRLTPTELAGYDGYYITTIGFMHNTTHSDYHNGDVRVYAKGNSTNPGSLITNESFNVSGYGWRNITLSSPVIINETEEYWVGVNITLIHPPDTSWFMEHDIGPAVDGKGDWLIHDGVGIGGGEWIEAQDISPPDTDFNHMIRAGLEATEPPNVYVDDDRPPEWYDATHVRTLQEGHTNASAGQTVFVYSGYYNSTADDETPVLAISKDVDFIGEDRNTTIIDGEDKHYVVVRMSEGADNVNFTGFTIRDNKYRSSDERGGVLLVGADNLNFYGNNISFCEIWGFITYNLIGPQTCNYLNIYDNIFYSNIGPWASLEFYDTFHSTIHDNYFKNNQNDIWISNSNNITIYHNYLKGIRPYSCGSLGTIILNLTYPNGGNYYHTQSHAKDLDLYSGPGQNITGSDGIRDTAYSAGDCDKFDYQPLMEPWGYAYISHNISPADNEENVTYSPFTEFTFSIEAINIKGELMNITFRTNASGIWNDIGSNNSVGNGIYSQQFDGIDDYKTKYWWSVNISVGNGNWTNETYMFETDYPLWDIVKDGIINYLDVSALVSHYGETGDPGWIPEDIVEDGVINYLDISLLISHYGEGY